MSCFISAKEQNYYEQGLESILWELVLEQESQLLYLSYDECIIEELRGCSLTVFSSGCFIFFFFGLCCSKGKFQYLGILKNPYHHQFVFGYIEFGML